MTNYVEFASVTGVANRVTDATAGDTLVIIQGVGIDTTSLSYDFTGGGLTATIAGVVSSSGGFGPLRTGSYVGGAPDTGGNSRISVTSSGALAGYNGIVTYGGGNSVSNAGSILANNIGIFMAGQSNSVVNTGLINTDQFGIRSFLDQGTASISIVNAGVISSGYTGIRADGTLHLENAGTIVGSAAAIFGIGAADIVNSGTIRSTSSFALGFNTGSAVSITNQAGGQITGVTAISQLSIGALTISNEGRITGAIIMAGGNDSYDGTLGTAIGLIDGAGGNDAISGGAGRENINGGNGNDDLDGGGGNDSFTAADNDGDDIYEGGAGVDRINFAGVTTGGVAVDIAGQSAGGIASNNIGNDTILNIEQIIGTGFTDSLFGDASANQFYGGGSGDTLVGFEGNDRLFGDAGTDNIIGGLGRDYLTGGADADTFRYQATSDSSFGSATRDLILDFVSDADVIANPLLVADTINLSAIDADGNAGNGNQAFTFIGYANSPAAAPSFTGVAGQLRAYTNVAGVTFAEGDTNGDLTPDLQIQIFGIHTMAAGDFVL